MTKEELEEYGALPQQGRQLPEGVRVVVCDLGEPKKRGFVYKDGALVFKVRSKSDSYMVRRLKKFINDITKEEK